LKNVLFISYYFPPINTPGAFRAGKFAKFLPELGWNPIILTIKPNKNDELDFNLLREIPESVRIFRVPSYDPKFKGYSKIRKFLPMSYSDGVFWKNRAIIKGYKIAKEFKIDLIWSTALPPVCHIVGKSLKKSLGCPLVLDYRDPWVGNPYIKYPFKFQRFIDFYIEKTIINEADAIVGISNSILNNINKNYSYSGKKILIPNGYDPDDFPDHELTIVKNTITHLGNLYGRRTQVALGFLQKLLNLENLFPDLSSKLSIQFIGNVHKSIIDFSIKNFQFINIKFLGKINHSTAIDIMCRSDKLLLIIEEKNVNTLASKVFEYIASNRPVLITGFSDEVSKLTKNFNNIFFINNYDEEMLLRILLFGNKIHDSEEFDDNLNRLGFLQNYSRKNQTSKLANVFNALCAKK